MHTSHRLTGGGGRLAGLSRFTAVLRLFALATAVLATASLPAQSGATGTISGRVFNPKTGEYVRNAEVRVTGTNLVDETEGNGFYQLFNVPAGEVSLSVTYPGFTSVTEN